MSYAISTRLASLISGPSCAFVEKHQLIVGGGHRVVAWVVVIRRS